MVLPEERPDVPRELKRRRRRGRHAGVEHRARRSWYRPVLPSIIMGNVRSLPNKMDELAALTRHQREYRECSLLLFTETWLTALTPDTAAELDGFTLLRADRSKESGKRKGGGLAVFVNPPVVLGWSSRGLRGHNVTCDNFFTSYELGQELLKRKITMVGTVRKNKPELPPALLASKEREVFFIKITTATKECVDNLDTVIGTYSCRRMTARWPLVIFHNIIDVSSYNAFVLWREINLTWMSRKQNKRRVFLEQLGKALVTPLIERRKHVPRTEASAAVVKAIQSAGAPDQPEDPATTATSPARA
ncbi:hypothetical protein L3Q82_018733, partial [Scortum barcoo]